MVRMVSLVSSGKWTMTASFSQTISLTGIFDGVGANFGPFSRMDRSAEESGLFDKLTTHLSLLAEVEWWVSVSLVRFVSFFAGLSSIVVRIDTESFLMMTNLSSTHRFQILGGTFEVGRTEPYNKNFLHQNSGHPLIFKPTLSIRPLTMIVHGITSVKLEDVFLTRKKNTSEMSRTILKDPRAVARQNS